MQLFLPKYERLKDRPPESHQKVNQLLRDIGEERTQLAALDAEIQSLNVQIRLKRGYLTPVLPSRHTRTSSLPPPTSLSPDTKPVGDLFPSMYRKDFYPRQLPAQQKSFGRPKDQAWEYREEMVRNKNLARGSKRRAV